MRKLGMILTTCLVATFMGCSDSKSTQTDAGSTGGRTATGGIVSSGGSIVTSGGVVSTGGSIVANGGSVGSGGNVVASGGSVGSGGSIVANGGSVGTGGATAPTGGTGGGTAGECNFPDCMSTFGKDCTPSGACTIQTNGMETNTCYANGVKEIRTMTLDMATASMKSTTTWKKGSTVCYSMDMDMTSALSGGAISYVIKNSSGSTIATGKIDSVTHVTTVTCIGGQPVVLNSACPGSSSNEPSTGGTTATPNACTSGTCTP